MGRISSGRLQAYKSKTCRHKHDFATAAGAHPPQTADTATEVSVIREGCSSVCSRGSGASSLPFIYIHHEQKQQMPGYT